MKLSDAYQIKGKDPQLELKVTVLNINENMNENLKKSCRTLKDYMAYVSRVRRCAKKMPVEDAVRRAVDECIKEGVLSDFLIKYKNEVISTSIFEYDEEREMRIIREDERTRGWQRGLAEGEKRGLAEGKKVGLAEGKKAGMAEGEKRGEVQILELMQMLFASGRMEDARRASEDRAYCRELLAEYGLASAKED